jgi:hypothetical protein
MVTGDVAPNAADAHGNTLRSMHSCSMKLVWTMATNAQALVRERQSSAGR